MKYTEIKDRSVGELQKLLIEQRDKLRDLRFRIAHRELKSVRDLRVVRQTIARLLTELNRRRHTEQH